MRQQHFLVWRMARMIILGFCGVMTMAAFTACTSDNDDNPSDPETPTEQTEYAILFYGYGGRTLDAGIMQNMLDFYRGQAESYAKVKIAVQYKYSSIENLQRYLLDASMADGDMTQEEADEKYERLKPMDLQTIRYIVDPTTANPEDDALLNPDNIYGQKNCDLAHVDSLTNFINWAVKACPAKHYVLVMADHRIYYADGRLEKHIAEGKSEPEVSTWPSTLKDTYEQLAFDRATGWSRWLYLNEQLPCEDSPVERHYPFGE